MALDVRASRELQAVVLAFRAAERNVRNGMRRAARRELNETWKPALQAAPATRLQRRVLVQGARVDVQIDTFRLTAANSKRPLKDRRPGGHGGGLIPAEQWHGAEFGANRYPQFGARRSPQGKVVFPTLRKVAPAAVAAWIRGAVGGLLAGTDVKTE